MVVCVEEFLLFVFYVELSMRISDLFKEGVLFFMVEFKWFKEVVDMVWEIKGDCDYGFFYLFDEIL